MSYSTAAQAQHRDPSQRRVGSTHIEDTSDFVDDQWWHREYMEHIMPRPGPGSLPPRAATLIHGTFHQLYKVTVTLPTFPPTDGQPEAKLQVSPVIGQSGSALSPSPSSAGLARHRPPSESEVRYLVPHPYVQFCRRDMVWFYHQVKSSMYLPQMLPNSGDLPSEAVRKSSQTCVEVDSSGVHDMSFSSSKAKTHHFHHYPKSVKGSSLNPPFVRRKVDIEAAAADMRRRSSKASSSSRHRAEASSAPSSDSNEILLDLWVCCQCQTYVISSGAEAVIPSILDSVLLQSYIRDREKEPTSRPSKEESVIYSLETILRIIENFIFRLDNQMVKVGANLIKKIGWTPDAQEFLAFLGFQHTPVTATETESHPQGQLQAPRLSEGSPENDIKRARLLQAWLELSIVTQYYRRKNDRTLQAYESSHKMWVSIENTFDETRRQIGVHETQIKQMPLTQSELIHDQARVFWDGLGTTPETHSAEMVKFAYQRQTQCDPQNTPTYFYFLRGVTDWAMRMRHSSAEGLQMLLGQEDSRGRWSTDELIRAAMLLAFLQEEDLSAIGDVQLPPNYCEDLRDAWLTRVKEANAELAENRINRQMADDRKRELKESFRILAEHSGSPEVVHSFRETMSMYGNGMVDVQDAYNTLKVPKEMDEDMVITVFNMRMEDRPNLRERMLSALLVIGEDRNSSRLKNLALTGTDEALPPPGSSSRDWSRALQELDNTCQLNSLPKNSSVPPLVSSSTMADTSSSAHSEPNENTALLPPDSRSQRSRSKFTSYEATSHPPLSPALSTSRCSTHLPSLPLRPIPLRQTPHPAWPIRFARAALISLASLSTVVLVATVFNIWLPRLIAPYLPVHRGSRVLPFWFAGIATWLSLTTLKTFWIPSRATRISLRTSLAMAFFDLIVLSTVPEFLHQESVLTTLTCILALVVIAICLLSNNLVQEAKEEEGGTIGSTAMNGREPERRAETLFLAEEQNYRMRQPRTVFNITMSFLIAFFANIILTLVTINLPIRTYDSTCPLPFKSSQLHNIRQSGLSHTFRVHLACIGSNMLHQRNNSASSDALKPGPLRRVPTILYEAPSKVSGTEGAEWLLYMRDRGKVGRVCLWDRPGYGFSDSSSDAEIGAIEEALWQALEKNGEKGPYLLVGEGYGGLLHQVFSARHANRTHGHIYIDAETSHTYFLSTHAHAYTQTIFFRSLLSPLGLHRILALPSSVPSRYPSQREINEGGTPLNRVLSPYLNPLTLSTVSQEQSLSHSLSSPSFTTLLTSLRYYPKDVPTIVISSTGRMEESRAWRRGQTSLWEEVTGEAGKVRRTEFVWGKDEDGNERNVWGRICADAGDAGRLICEDAVSELLWS